MEYRDFGATGISVSDIGVGCSRIGGMFSAGSSRHDEVAMLHAALDAGINFFDTADMYSQGQSEVLLGRALKRRRQDAIIATKGGYVVPPQRRLLALAKPIARPLVKTLKLKRPAAVASPAAGPIDQDFSPSYIVAAVDASLRRLGTDYIDIYQLHSPPQPIIDGGEYIDILERLRSEGKIRHFGIAADRADHLTGFHRHPAIDSLQVPFSLLEPGAQAVVFPQAAEQRVGVIARSCFAAGLFSEARSDASLKELTPDWKEILRLRAAARALDRPLLEAALQFSLHAPAVSVTILGMRTPAHLTGNLRHYQSRPLDAEELETLVEGAP